MWNNTKKIIKKIKQLKNNNQVFTVQLIDTIAKAIRTNVIDCTDRDILTPITGITNKFGITVYHTDDLKLNEIGNLYINHTVARNKNKNKLILLQKNETLYTQRYATAHLLGDYLFHYINSEHEIENLEYIRHCKPYNTGVQNRISQQFAMAILLPSQQFINEHNYALTVDNTKGYVIKHLAKQFQVTDVMVERKIHELRQRQKKT